MGKLKIIIIEIIPSVNRSSIYLYLPFAPHTSYMILRIPICRLFKNIITMKLIKSEYDNLTISYRAS